MGRGRGFGFGSISPLAVDREKPDHTHAHGNQPGLPDSHHAQLHAAAHAPGQPDSIDGTYYINEGQAAGGVLGGTFPSPSFAVDMATQAELDAHAATSHGIDMQAQFAMLVVP